MPTTPASAEPTAIAEIESELLAFLQRHIRLPMAPDTELFTSGAVTSLFALKLVIHVETTYGVAVAGDDLSLENFRTARAMAQLVDRLRTQATDG